MSDKRFRLPLDNAAKIYPAVRNRKWSNVFRLSVTLKDAVDPIILQSALAVTIKRFPSMAMKLDKNFFWYYLEEISVVPKVRPDTPSPCSIMPLSEIKTCAFRVLYGKNRIAAEFFHSITDGNGGLIFLKTLTAEYLLQKENVEIPFIDGVLDRAGKPDKNESEDSFLKYHGKVAGSRQEETAYRIQGTKEPDGLRNIITGVADLNSALAASKTRSVSLTTLLVSVMIYSIMEIQNKNVPDKSKQKPIKVLVPVNLRKYFKSSSFRNFVLYVTPGINASMGDYALEEIIQIIHHQMKIQVTEKQMKARVTANVKTEQNRFLRILPLFMKNLGMKAAYSMIDEKKSCITMSNLGRVTLPEEMDRFIERFDFTLGVQSRSHNNCGIISYGGRLYINMIRNIKESELESLFFENLKSLGVDVDIEDNREELGV